MAVAVSVSVLKQRPARLHRVYKTFGRRCFAAVVRHQQDIGFQRLTHSLHQRLLLHGFYVCGQQHGVRLRAYAQYTTAIVWAHGFVVVGSQRVNEIKLHAVPLPCLPGLTALQGQTLRQPMRVCDGGPQLCLFLLFVNRQCATGVVAVLVAEHQRVKVFVHALQHRQQHALSGVAVHAEARAGVKQQTVLRCTHQHRVALPYVGKQQLRHTVRRSLCLPKKHRHHHCSTSDALPQFALADEQRATRNAYERQPPRRRCGLPHSPGQGLQRFECGHQQLQTLAAQLPQRRPQHTGKRQRRHHKRDPGNRIQIHQQADNADLLKQQQRERRQPQRDEALFAQ